MTEMSSLEFWSASSALYATDEGPKDAEATHFRLAHARLATMTM
jgi:hypothetical protein